MFPIVISYITEQIIRRIRNEKFTISHPKMFLHMNLLFLLFCLFISLASSRRVSKNELHEKQRAAAKRFTTSGPGLKTKGTVKNITFSNPRASGE